MAGLAAALRASRERGRTRIVVWEQAKQAGGRCRSFHDPQLDALIDNGSHLVLACNRAARAYLAETGGARQAELAPEARFPLVDLRTGERIALHLGWKGMLPRIDLPRGAVGGALLRDVARFWLMPRAASVAEIVATSPAYAALWEPLVTAVMNEPPASAAPRPFRRVLRECLAAGPGGVRPLSFPRGLSAAFVEPTLAALALRGVEINYGRRLQALELNRRRPVALGFRHGREALQVDDKVVLAVPSAMAAALLPDRERPNGVRGILNAHFAVDEAERDEPLLGVIGGTVQWIFRRGAVLSATVSAAERLFEREETSLASELWRDVAMATGRDTAVLPRFRMVREKAATFSQTVENEALRPEARTSFLNLFLAGDYTRTGLPATIEGAIRSGNRAAAWALAAL